MLPEDKVSEELFSLFQVGAEKLYLLVAEAPGRFDVAGEQMRRFQSRKKRQTSVVADVFSQKVAAQ